MALYAWVHCCISATLSQLTHFKAYNCIIMLFVNIAIQLGLARAPRDPDKDERL